MNDVLNLINEELLAVADPEKAPGMKAYMKDHFEYLGVASPERKVVVRFVWENHKDLIRQEWRDLIRMLWDTPRREYQYVAMDLMAKVKTKLVEEDIALIEELVLQKSWWDTVDFLASNMVGKYFEKFPQHIDKYINEWKRSDIMWLNRTAIIFQLKYKDKLDFDLLTEQILYHIDSKEFFINKASGWALRQHSKAKPDEVAKFVAENPSLSSLIKREASKYLK